MKKILNIGTMETGRTRSNIFLKVEIEAGKLSISGVIGPRASGNAAGGCGQIDMEFDHGPKYQQDNDARYSEPVKASEIKFAEGWTPELWHELLHVWHEWHLNDMQPACEHQRAAGWTQQAKEKIRITEWHLMGSASSQQKEIEEKAIKELISNRSASISYDEAEILGLEYELTTYGDEEPPFNLRMYYTRSKTDEKTRGWISFEDSEHGILSKPCPTCGYKYGSAWLKMELPAEVIEFVESLPESAKAPAWV